MHTLSIPKVCTPLVNILRASITLPILKKKNQSIADHVDRFSLVWVLMYSFGLWQKEQSVNHKNYGEQNLSWNVYYWYLVIFIYSNSTFVVNCKNADFECRYIRTHTKEKPSNIKLAILLFYLKNIPTKLLSWVLWNPLLMYCNPTMHVLHNGSSF